MNQELRKNGCCVDRRRGIPCGGNGRFNLSQDIIAANIVFASRLDLWQIPISAYRFVRVSMTELQHKVKPCGEIGKYLFSQMLACHMARATDTSFTEGNPNPLFTPLRIIRWNPGAWGNQPTVSVLLDAHMSNFERIPAPQVTKDMFYVHNTGNRPIRVYKYIDSYMTMEDFYAKLAIWYPKKLFS